MLVEVMVEDDKLIELMVEDDKLVADKKVLIQLQILKEVIYAHFVKQLQCLD